MKQFFFFVFLCSFCAQAQIKVRGIIKDEITKKPLPFATIQTDEGSFFFSDVNGFFEIQLASITGKISLQYLNYFQKTIIIPENGISTIYLQPKKIAVTDLIVQQQKTKLVVESAFRLSHHNNPKKAYKSFEYKGYNKLIISADSDSISSKTDTLFKKGKIKIDSTEFKFKKLIAKQHLFVTEKVALYQYNNQRFKETVLGSQMSGFKKPIYEIIGLNLQPHSVYASKYELLETKYVNPISKSGLKDYDYQLLDTVLIDNRTVFTVYFKNKKQINLKGLEGLLFIDAENFGIAKAIMRVQNIIDLTAIHEFEYIADEKIWFPKNSELKIIKGKNDDPIKILGETFEFEGTYDELGTKQKKKFYDFVFLQSQSHYFDRKINRQIDIKRPSVAIEIDELSELRDTAFWSKSRKVPFTNRDSNTFAAEDSLAFLKGINAKLFLGRKIINGYVPLGFYDLDLRYLVSYNNYEGFRFGIGGKTNERLSKHYKLENYLAYGLKDDKAKYHFGGSSRIGNFSNTWAGLSFTDDVQEIGSTKFNIDKRIFKIYDPRPINVSTFYHHKTWRAFVESNFLPKTESIWQINHSKIEPLFNYAFFDGENLFNEYTMTTASFSIQWNLLSDYMHTPNNKIEIEKRFPKFTFQFTQALPTILGNDFIFSKIDSRIEYEKKFVNGQKSAVLIQSGLTFGDLPLTHLYNNSPNNLDRDVLLQRITVAGKNSFETMRFNEFFSSRYIMLHLKHGFKRIELFKKVKPSLVLVTRMAWGDMQNPSQHIGLDYKTIERGYFESGVEFNQIFQGFGLAGFYRYGPNQLSRFEDNIALKISFQLDLGF